MWAVWRGRSPSTFCTRRTARSDSWQAWQVDGPRSRPSSRSIQMDLCAHTAARPDWSTPTGRPRTTRSRCARCSHCRWGSRAPSSIWACSRYSPDSGSRPGTGHAKARNRSVSMKNLNPTFDLNWHVLTLICYQNFTLLWNLIIYQQFLAAMSLCNTCFVCK